MSGVGGDWWGGNRWVVLDGGRRMSHIGGTGEGDRMGVEE